MGQAGNEVSIVIVNWNAKDELAASLESIEREATGSVETIVVDNGSSDGSLAMLAARFPAVRAIDAGANLGFAEGVNRGIAVATRPWIFTLNNDAVLAPGCLARLGEAIARASVRTGMIQLQLVFKDAPDRVNSTGLLLFRSGAAMDRDFDVPVERASRDPEVFCPTAGAALYRRTMLDALRLRAGWFDRTHFMYCEDLDLGWRARLAGWEARYEPEAVVLHRFQGSSRRRGEAWVVRMCRINRVRTLVKNASFAFIARSWLQTARDARAELRSAGIGALADLARAAWRAWPQRGEVRRLLARDRRDVERRWAVRGVGA